MKCLTCGEENNNVARNCYKCNAQLLLSPDSDTDEHELKIRVSRLAITGIGLAIAGAILYISCSIIERHFKFSDTNVLTILAFLGLSISVTAIIIGIISFIIIEVSGGRVTGVLFSIGAVLIPVFTMFTPAYFAIPVISKSRAFKMVCSTNLSDLGKAMFIYANDYDYKFPRAGGPGSIWGTSVNYRMSNPILAFRISREGSGGYATISSSLFLLVKYAEVKPKSFICAENSRDGTGDKGVTEYEPPQNQNPIFFWDFGPEPWKHNSYAYQMPYGAYTLTTSSDPGMAVAADRNPWIPSPGWNVKKFFEFNTDGDKTIINEGNTPCHSDEGQNVLYLDGNVNFEDKSFCGVNKDNIYTLQKGSDISRGSQPVFGDSPVNKTDSLLVNDPVPQKP